MPDLFFDHRPEEEQYQHVVKQMVPVHMQKHRPQDPPELTLRNYAENIQVSPVIQHAAGKYTHDIHDHIDNDQRPADPRLLFPSAQSASFLSTAVPIVIKSGSHVILTVYVLFPQIYDELYHSCQGFSISQISHSKLWSPEDPDNPAPVASC